MTICIGHMGGTGWRAELDFPAGQAHISQPISPGASVDVATVPLGDFTPETADRNPELERGCEVNQRLCSLLYSPDAWACLRTIRDQLTARRPLEDRGEIKPYQHEREDAEMLDEIGRVLELLIVPGDGE